MTRGLSRHCIYTIRHEESLEDAFQHGRSETFIENRPWVTARDLWLKAQSAKLGMPVLFSDALRCGPLLFWGLLKKVDIVGEQTHVTVDKMRRLWTESHHHRARDLVLRSSGKRISPNFIRPYAICETPSFIDGTTAGSNGSNDDSSEASPASWSLGDEFELPCEHCHNPCQLEAGLLRHTCEHCGLEFLMAWDPDVLARMQAKAIGCGRREAAHFAYWPQYLEESGAHGRPITNWLTSRDKWIKRIKKGDSLWLFISGKACKKEGARARQGYLAEVFLIASTENYARFQPRRAKSPQFQIVADPDRCVLVDPPLLIDELLRRPGKSKHQHIGVSRQNPFQVDEMEVTRIMSLLREKRPKVAETIEEWQSMLAT